MGGVFAAYVLTTGIVVFRWIKEAGQLPPPIALAGTGFVYAGCALLGKADPRLGNTAAWGVSVAAFMAHYADTTNPDYAPLHPVQMLVSGSPSATAPNIATNLTTSK